MPMNVPLCFRSDDVSGSASLEGERVRSGWESEGAGLGLRSRLFVEEEDGRRIAEDASLPFRCCAEGPSLNM